MKKAALTILLFACCARCDTDIYFDVTKLTFAGSGTEYWSRWGGSFSPTEVDGLSLWVDFSASDSIASDGGAISQINDLSGRDMNLVQSSAGSRPLVSSAAQNGLDVALFDGSDDWLYVAGAGLGYTADVFVVMKILTYSTSGLFMSSPQNGYMAGSYLLGGAVEGQLNVINSDGQNLASVPFSVNAFHVLRICFSRDGATDSSILSTEGNTDEFTYGNRIFASNLDNFDLGRYNAPGHYQHCQIGEILIYSNKVSESESASIISHLNSKWGL